MAHSGKVQPASVKIAFVIRIPTLLAAVLALALAIGGLARAQARYGHAPAGGPPAGGYHASPFHGPSPGPRPGSERPPFDYRPSYGPGPPPPESRGEARPYAAPRGPEPIVGWRAAPEPPPGPSPRLGRMASLGWVIERIRRRSPGRQLDAEIISIGGRPAYRVIWFTVHGRRVDYLVDAFSGAILNGP
jgi:hypothetical protein